LIAGNLCLRQQFLVLERRTPRPRLRDRDRRSYLDSRLSMVASMARALLVVQPNDGRMELLRPTLYRQPLPLTLGDPPEAHGAAMVSSGSSSGPSTSARRPEPSVADSRAGRGGPEPWRTRRRRRDARPTRRDVRDAPRVPPDLRLHAIGEPTPARGRRHARAASAHHQASNSSHVRPAAIHRADRLAPAETLEHVLARELHECGPSRSRANGRQGLSLPM
jgi:hypothetical protein